MQAIEELKRLYREGKVSGNELHCVISSVLIHASLREPITLKAFYQKIC